MTMRFEFSHNKLPKWYAIEPSKAVTSVSKLKRVHSKSLTNDIEIAILSESWKNDRKKSYHIHNSSREKFVRDADMRKNPPYLPLMGLRCFRSCYTRHGINLFSSNQFARWICFKYYFVYSTAHGMKRFSRSSSNRHKQLFRGWKESPFWTFREWFLKYLPLSWNSCRMNALTMKRHQYLRQKDNQSFTQKQEVW